MQFCCLMPAVKLEAENFAKFFTLRFQNFFNKKNEFRFDIKSEITSFVTQFQKYKVENISIRYDFCLCSYAESLITFLSAITRLFG